MLFRRFGAKGSYLTLVRVADGSFSSEATISKGAAPPNAAPRRASKNAAPWKNNFSQLLFHGTARRGAAFGGAEALDHLVLLSLQRWNIFCINHGNQKVLFNSKSS